MRTSLWNVFCENGDPICYLLCKVQEDRGKGSEVIGIPDEFKMNPPQKPEPVSPH